MSGSKIYSCFLNDILDEITYSSSDIISIYVKKNYFENLDEYCNRVSSIRFFTYKYKNYKYYRVINGLISSYSIENKENLITLRSDLNNLINKSDLITKKLYLRKILFTNKIDHCQKKSIHSCKKN